MKKKSKDRKIGEIERSIRNSVRSPRYQEAKWCKNLRRKIEKNREREREDGGESIVVLGGMDRWMDEWMDGWMVAQFSEGTYIKAWGEW